MRSHNANCALGAVYNEAALQLGPALQLAPHALSLFTCSRAQPSAPLQLRKTVQSFAHRLPRYFNAIARSHEVLA